MRACGAVVSHDFTLTHENSDDNLRLWVPDQVVGAYGDALSGDRRAWGHLEACTRVERVNLS